jgi:NAD(P)-dependent dehydrogenase (short-subunit alcohol dehydrogenase family)
VTRRLDGKVCVVTGATGIAAAAARRFAREGSQVFVVSREEDECVELCGQIPGAAYAVADLADEAATLAAFDTCRARHDRLDALFAVAGSSGRADGDGPAHVVPLSGWEATMRRNATPAFLAAREAVRTMLPQAPNAAGTRGSVVLMSSVLAFDPAPTLFATHAYAAAKAAIAGLARAMAASYAPHGIRVNAVAPGLVDTPMSVRAAADRTSVAFARRKQPLAGGFLPPEDVAELATFLCSDESRHLTGQVVAVDGGWTVRGEDR